MAVHCLRTLRAALTRVQVVVRPGEAALRALLEAEGAPVVECALAPLGMGHSLACGVAAAAEATGWVVTLGDMPRLQSQTIRAVAACLESGAGIAIPTFGGRRGHPVGFSARHRSDLLALSGDEGARHIVRSASSAVVELALDDPGVLADVDTREDLAGLRLPPP